MKYSYITFATVAMAAALFSSSSNHHAQAGLPRLLKRAATAFDIAECIRQVLSQSAFDTKCVTMFATPGEVQAVTSIQLGELDFDFTDPNELIVTLSSPEMNVGVLAVPGIPIPITASRQFVTLVDKGVDIATFNTPWALGVMDGNTLRTSVKKTVVNIIPEKRDEFSAFIAALIVNPQHTFILKGTVDVNLTVSLPAPPKPPSGFPGFGGGAADTISKLAPSKTFTVSGIAFSSDVTLTGFNNFPDITFVEELEKTTNADGSFTIKSKVNIKNTSQLDVKMGDVCLKTFDAMSNEPIGETVLVQFEAKRGDNFVTAVTTSTVPAAAAAEIYKRVTEQGETFRFKGFAESSKVNTILAKGISTVDTTVVIPALSKLASAPAPGSSSP